MNKGPKKKVRRGGAARKINGLVGQALLRNRMSCGLSRTQVETECGLPRGSMRRIEDGVRSVSAGELYMIAAQLNIDPDHVFDGLPVVSDIGAAPDQMEVKRLVHSYTKISDQVVRKRLLQMARAAVDRAVRKA